MFDRPFDDAVGTPAPPSQDAFWEEREVLDQALALVAEHHASLGAMIGRPTIAPNPADLRRSPLGHDLRLLAAAAKGAADPREGRAAIARVRAVMLRPLAGEETAVPAWFQETALGRLIAAAERAIYAPTGLLTIAEAATRLGADEATIDRWLAEGAMPSATEESGQVMVPRAIVDRWRLIKVDLDSTSDPALEDALVRIDHRLAS